MFFFQQCLLIALIVGLPGLVAVAVVGVLGPLGAPIALIVYAVLYGLVAGVLSLRYRSSVRAGRFDRDLATRAYRGRRLYNFCWTMVAYFPPVVHLFTSLKPLKRLLVTLFGCPALADATFYPDTWIRDLPLLELGPGAYLGNRATIGTNTCLTNGRIVVGKIRIGEGAVVGHLAGIGNGSRLGAGSELGFRASVGMRSRVGVRTRVGGETTIAHGAVVGDDVVIGIGSFIGSRCRIGNGITIPEGTTIPDRTALRVQEDVDALLRRSAGAVRRSGQRGMPTGHRVR